MILHGITSQGRRCAFLARGALKSKKRFAGGVLDPLQYIEVVATVSAKKDSLMNLDEAHLIDGFDELRTNYDLLEAAFWATDIVGKISTEDDPNNKSLFDLLGHGLRTLKGELDPDIFKIHFGLKVLHAQGVLQTDEWMLPYLERPLSDCRAIADSAVRNHVDWIEYQFKIYVSRAEVL